MMPSASLRCTTAVSILTLGTLAASACGGTGAADRLFGGGGTAPASTSTDTGATTSSTGTAATSSGTASTTSGALSSGTAATGAAATASSSTGASTGTGTTGPCQAGYACVDDDPPGGNFGGHYYVTETALPAQDAPPCPAGLAARTEFEAPSGPAQCTTCTCGGTCTPPVLTCWPGSEKCDGGGSADWTSALEDGACHDPTSLLGNNDRLSCKITAPAMPIPSGSCKPSSVDFPNKQTWQTRIDACGGNGSAGSCGAGKVCIPVGASTTGASFCVRSDGDLPCPAGWDKAIHGYRDGTDTRTCTACSCGAGDTTCGDGGYTFYDAPLCVAASATDSAAVSAMQCTDLSTEIAAGMGSAQATVPKPKSTCPAGGGAAIGVVTPGNPITYCCQ